MGNSLLFHKFLGTFEFSSLNLIIPIYNCFGVFQQKKVALTGVDKEGYLGPFQLEDEDKGE